MDPFAVAPRFISGPIAVAGNEPALLILSSRETQSPLMELKAPKTFQAFRLGLVAQAYQVFPSDLPSGELGYHLLLQSLLLPSVLKVSLSRNNAYWIVSLGVKA